MRVQRFLGARVAAMVAAVAILSIAESSQATEVTYLLNMNGAQEVPGPGDSDGLATGFITLNDVSGLINWFITYSAIAAPSAMHIHGPNAPPGSSAGVFIGLNLTGSPGVLNGSLTAAPASVAQVIGSPTGFYVNIHNSDFPGGAIRGQLGTLPAPAALSLLALGGLAQRRRRR